MSGLVPLVDAAAIVLTLALAGPLDAFAVAFGVTAFGLLRIGHSPGTRVNPRLSDQVGTLFAQLSAALLIMTLVAVPDARLAPFFRSAPLVVGGDLAGRALAYRAMRAARASGLVREPTLVVGAGQLGQTVVRTLREHPEFGLVPVGFVDAFDDAGLPAPILGTVDELEPIVAEFAVRRVIVAFGATREPDMVQVIRACDQLPVEVHVLPRFFELGVFAAGSLVDDVWGIPLIRLRRAALRTVAWRTKRAFDLVVATLGLVASLPAFALAALAVKLSSPGPVFFRQKRIGQRGETFELLKFRTMLVNDDSDTTWSVAADERLTAVGRIMRRVSLDELPQLINVVRGEMSLVGPRPERPFFADHFRVSTRGYDDRHRVPTGMTGWAQVHGLRGDTSIPERTLFDNNYIENWSLWRDVVVLFRTMWLVVTGSGR